MRSRRYVRRVRCGTKLRADECMSRGYHELRDRDFGVHGYGHPGFQRNAMRNGTGLRCRRVRRVYDRRGVSADRQSLPQWATQLLDWKPDLHGRRRHGCERNRVRHRHGLQHWNVHRMPRRRELHADQPVPARDALVHDRIRCVRAHWDHGSEWPELRHVDGLQRRHMRFVCVWNDVHADQRVSRGRDFVQQRNVAMRGHRDESRSREYMRRRRLRRGHIGRDMRGLCGWNGVRSLEPVSQRSDRVRERRASVYRHDQSRSRQRVYGRCL